MKPDGLAGVLGALRQGVLPQTIVTVAVARKSYDAVLIETAPVLASSDALRLVSIADIHLHVVSWRKTQRRPALLAIQHFKKIGARMSGIVFIDADLP